jgi:hypothetical protein
VITLFVTWILYAFIVSHILVLNIFSMRMPAHAAPYDTTWGRRGSDVRPPFRSKLILVWS